MTTQPKENISYLTLDQLNKKCFYRRTVVRLIRKWEARNFKKHNELIGIDFLLLDEKDNTIQGSVHHSFFAKFGNQLCEGNLIEICNFNLQDCNKSYRVSDHKFLIRFNERATIARMEQQFCQISVEKFRFQNYENFAKLEDMTYDLYDAIGYIKEMEKSDVHTHNTSMVTHNTSTVRRVTLTLLLESGIEIPATIWAEEAEQFEEKYCGIKSDNTVLIMTSVLIKIFECAIRLSTSFATKFYLNQDFDSVIAFRKSFKYDGGCSVNLGRLIEHHSTNNRRPEVQHSINDIWEFISSEEHQDKLFACKATITNIVLRSGWNYISCSTCSTKLFKSTSSLMCNKCGKSQSVGVLSFRIEVIVDDGNDSATFVLFDEAASKITGTTAEDIKNNSDEQGLEQIPTSVQSIVGETYLFEVKIKKKDFESSYQTFTASDILDHLKTSTDDKISGSKREDCEEREESTGVVRKKPRIEG